MYNIIRFYNQNRKKLLKIILIIVFVIALIQLLNYLVKVNQENVESKNIIENALERTNTAKDALISNKSIISDTNVSEKNMETEINIIDDFINYCNNKDINNAYNLLTEECKELMYPTVEDFYKSYYSITFNNENKTYTIENWSGNTYQVMITEDILLTGKVNNSITRQDYMTIISKDGEKRLNINSYIGRKKINKITTKNYIEFVILNKDIYMDYEVYNFKVTNNSNNKILLDNCQNTKSVYLLDGKDVKYYFYNNEIIENRFIIESSYTNNLNIKFNRSYSPSRSVEKMVFSNVILNYDEYNKLDDKTNYKDVYKLEVGI